MERGIILRGIFKEIITLLIFYFGMRLWWGEEDWFNDKTKEMIFFVSVGLIYFIASFFTSLISRPIKINVNQTNSHYNDSKTNLSIKGARRTQQHERSVELTLTVNRKNSVWSFLSLKLLSRYDLKVLIEPISPGIILDPERGPIRNDIIETRSGFKINLSDYISSILMNSHNGLFIKKCKYVITEDSLNVVTNETLNVVPRLVKSNGSSVPRLITFLLSFNNLESGHVVNFKWE